MASHDTLDTNAAISEIVTHVQNVKNKRSLGLLLDIETGKLDGFEKDPKTQTLMIIKEWFDQTPMTIQDRWDELGRVLLEPALKEVALAKKLHPQVRRGSSIDSAISELSNTPVTSPVDTIPPQYQISYLEELRNRTDECTMQNVLNCIALYSEWYIIGINLGLLSNDLEMIRQQYPSSDPRPHLVELWKRMEPDGLSWIKLYWALKGVIETRYAGDSASFLEQPSSSLSPPPHLIPEEPPLNSSFWSEPLTTDEEAVKLEMDRMRELFEEIQYDALDTFEENGVKVKRFIRSLSTYPGQQPTQKMRGRNVPPPLKTVSKDHVDIDEIFRIWNSEFVWSFLDVALLEHVVKRLGSADLQRRMNRYLDCLKRFRERTTVFMLVRVWPQLQPPCDYEACARAILKLEKDPKVCTLENLETIRNQAVNNLSKYILSQAALVFCTAQLGSVTLTWVVHRTMVHTFKEIFRKCIDIGTFFKENDIQQLWLDGEYFIPRDETFTTDLAHEDRNCSAEERFGESCKIGHFEDVKRCLTKENLDPNVIYEKSKGWNAVMCAAFYGHSNVVRLLIECGAEVNKQDYTGCTALILASNERHLDVVELLLEKGADPNIVENHGLCPLLIGAKWNLVNLVRLVCVKSPLTKMDIVDMDSKTALILAAEEGNVDVVRFLLREEFLERIDAEHQDEYGRAAIHAAAESGNVEIADLLLTAFPETRDVEDKGGNTPASIAKRTNNKDLVALLSPEDEGEGKEIVEEEVSEEKEGMPVEGAVGATMEGTQTTRRFRSTIIRLFRSAKWKNLNLLRAAKAGNARKVEKLLKSGAEPNTIEIDTLQWTPLMWASQKNHVETVKVLLRYKADPNCQARNGFTALILASRLGNHEVVKVLLDPTNPIKTDVQIKNKTRQWSALMWACQSRGKQFDNEEARANRRIIAKDLLDKGADINSEADNGWTPIMQASQDGDVEMVKILTSHESSKNCVEIDHESDSTWTALTTACRKKHLDIIKALVDAGADVNKKKKGGVAPLHITAIKQMVEASEYLIKHKADVNIQDDWGITPLMLAVKENDREKQDYQKIIHYHIVSAKANVNVQAEKFAKWTAVFFSIKNKDQKTSKILVRNKAKMDIKDEYGHTPFSISKGLILDEKIQMYKFLVNLVFPPEEEESKEDSTPEVSHRKGRESLAEEKSFSVADGAVYTAMDLRFRMTQLPNYLVNFNWNLPAF